MVRTDGMGEVNACRANRFDRPGLPVERAGPGGRQKRAWKLL